MRTIRIYSMDDLVAGATLELSGGGARHIVQVLRLGAGAAINLFNGSGNEYPAVITAASKASVTLQLGQPFTPATESALALHLWHGLCRGSRMDTVVQKATELGVMTIQPVITERDIMRLDPARAKKKVAHWRSIAISACEQSGRARIPVIHAPRLLTECLAGHAAAADNRAVALMCDPDGEVSLVTQLVTAQPTIVLTGPEGGFSPAEKAAAAAAGFLLVSLGPRILRTETAPVVALGLVQGLAGDLQNL